MSSLKEFCCNLLGHLVICQRFENDIKPADFRADYQSVGDFRRKIIPRSDRSPAWWRELISVIASGLGINFARMTWRERKMIDTKDRVELTIEDSPFSISPKDAISHLRSTGDWPVPSPVLAEPASDYYVLAAFWNDPDGLLAYLAAAWAGMAVAV